MITMVMMMILIITITINVHPTDLIYKLVMLMLTFHSLVDLSPKGFLQGCNEDEIKRVEEEVNGQVQR